VKVVCCNVRVMMRFNSDTFFGGAGLRENKEMTGGRSKTRLERKKFHAG